MKKKILIGIIIGIVVLCICMFLTDKYMIEHHKEPVFVYKSKIANDGGSYTAKGLFYTIHVQKNIYADIEKIEMYVFDKCIAASIADFHYLPNEQNHLTSVIIKNNKISNENLIDEFIEKAINTNTKSETLEIVQDNTNIKLTYTPGEYAQIMANSEGKDSVSVPIGDGSQEDYKRIYGYYTIIINDEVKGDYSLTSHNIVRSTKDGIVTVHINAELIEYTDIIKICTYDLESSNYAKKFDINYNQRKDLGIKEIYDNKEYKLKTFGGDINVTLEKGDAVYTLEDIINRKLITCEDILEQVKMDTKYGICQEGYYSDGGSTEYLYEDYTIIKLNTLDGDKDLIIGMKGSILSSYNKEKVKNVSGIIERIENNTLFVYCDGKVNENFINMRTREKISLDEIKVNDYYESKGEIARNILGDELKQELLKNMEKCFQSGPLYANPLEITNLENREKFTIIDVKVEDVLSSKLGKEFNTTVNMKLKVTNETNIPTVQKVDINNLKEETNGFMFWIEIAENTIDEEYPIVKTIEIYDK